MPDPDALAEALKAEICAAYIQGATDVHEHWAAGNVEREPDFAEAASDYAATRSAPERLTDVPRPTNPARPLIDRERA